MNLKRSVRKTLWAGLVAFWIVLSGAITAEAGWLFYSKPEYRGRIIDAETKAPIEGVVIVAIYWTDSIVGGPAGPTGQIIKE